MEEEFKAGEIGTEVPIIPGDVPQPLPESEPPHEPEEEIHSLADSVRSLSPMQLVAKRFFRSKLSIVGLCIIIFLFAFCWIGPLFSPYEEEAKDYETDRLNIVVSAIEVEMTDENGNVVLDDNGDPVVYTVYRVQRSEKGVDELAAASPEHWFGTDKQGYDVFTRIMYGGRISLSLSLIVVIMETILGIIFGGLAGYFGKWVDTLIMRIVDIFSCIPSLPLLLIIGSVLDGIGVDVNNRIYFMMIFLTLFGWTGIARIVRGQILSLREQEFMVSATARGLSTPRKIFRHLVPNVMPQLIVSMTLGLGSVILMEASLSYLGLGVPLTKASWGGMINDVKDPMVLQNYLNLWVPPGICIVLAVLGFNFIGDGLRDAFDPKSKR